MTTLNTGIYVHDPVDPVELHNFALTTTLAFDDAHRNLSDFEIVLESEAGQNGIWCRTMKSLAPPPVSSAVWYRNDGPAQTEQEAEDRAKNCPNAPDCHEGVHAPAYHVLLGLTSHVLYNDSRGWNCGHLHAAMLWAIGGFLDTKGVRWCWTNELVTQLHTGYDALDGLGEAARKAIRDNFPTGLLQMLNAMFGGGVALGEGAGPVDMGEALRKMFGLDSED